MSLLDKITTGELSCASLPPLPPNACPDCGGEGWHLTFSSCELPEQEPCTRCGGAGTIIPMISLPHVTLLCADCLNGERAIVAIERSKLNIEFGAVKLLTSEKIAAEFPGYPHFVVIPSINSINDYSAFCIKRLHEFIDTTHCLLVQHDGCVLNANAWRPQWNDCDFIGPLFEQEQVVTAETVGSGGFSYRSKRLCTLTSQFCPAWDGKNSYDGPDGRNNWGHEDGVICKHLRQRLVGAGMKFAAPAEAASFAFGRSKHLHDLNSFGFHGYCPETESRGVDSEKVQYAAAKIKLHYATQGGPLTREQVLNFLAV